MRRVGIVISIVVVVLIVTIVAAALLVNVDKYRPRVQAELQNKLDRPVTLGHLSLRLFPLSIRVDGLTIGESPAFSSSQPFAQAAQVYVSARLFSLIRGNPEVRELDLNRPRIELIRNSAGGWNFSTIGKANQANTQTTTQPSSKTEEFTLNKLKIADGQVGVTDQLTRSPRSVYDHIDLLLTDFGPNKQFGLDLGMHFPGPGKELFAFKGKAGPLQAGNTVAVPIDGRFTLQEVSLAGVNHFSPGALPANTDSIISGYGNISSAGTLVSCKGDLKLEDTMIRGAKLGYPVEATYDLSDDRKEDQIQIRSGFVKLGATSFSVSGEVAAGAKPMNLNVRLTTNNSSISELAKLAGAAGVAFNPAYQVSGTVSADITAKGPATAPQLNGNLSARQLNIRGGEIKEPVSVPQIALTLTPDAVVSSPFTAQSGSTALTGSFTLSHYATPNKNIDAIIKTNGANIAELLNVAKAYGVTAAEGATGSGTLSMNVHVQGPLSQPAQLVYAGTANIPSATLATKSLTQPLVINSANLQFAQNSASLAAAALKAEGFALSNVRANARFGPGLVQLSPVTADIFGGKANGVISMDTKPVHPLCSVNLKTSGVDTNALLSAVSSAKDTLYGSLASESNVHFNLESGAELAKTLNGTVNFNVTNGHLKNTNLMNELSRVGKFVGSTATQSASGTALKQLSATLNIVNGVATTNNLKAVLDAGSLSANGSMNLVTQALDMHMTAVLSNGTSKAVGGTQVGGFLNTALANNKGELVLPVIVTGTTAHPVFAPDVEAIAKMKATNLLPTTSGLAGSALGQKGVGGVVGGLLGQPSNHPGQQKNQQQNPVNSLLNQFGQKKPPKKQ
ncbi:MAG: AsmA family protein [Acidobacteriaceae bacterium]|nr:AsmA family protein [Acidobacteriaceae bacterium]